MNTTDTEGQTSVERSPSPQTPLPGDPTQAHLESNCLSVYIRIRDGTPLAGVIASEGYGIAAQREAREGNFRKAESYHGLSNVAGTAAQWSHEERVGKTEININQRFQQRQHNSNTHFGDRRFSTAFNYWYDEDGSGKYSLSELKGVKDVFSLSNEKQVIFCTNVKGCAGNDVDFYLYDNNDQPLAHQVQRIGGNNALGLITYDMQTLKEIGARGRCLVNWRVNGKVIDIYQVTFVD